jgi:MFS family permease
MAHTAPSVMASGSAPRPSTSGSLPGLLLLIGSCMPVLGAVLIAPLLPKIQSHFSTEPHVDVLVPILLTAPALMIALLAPFAGSIVDRFGRKKLLLLAMVLYAIAGSAPLWLDDLRQIIFSRVFVGLAEAAIMTCCTVLLGDYYDGARRDRYIGLQTICTTVAGTLFFIIGGALGEGDWRSPFWIYLISLLLVPLMFRVLWEPLAPETRTGEMARQTPMPWRFLLLVCLITFMAALLFFVIPVQLGFLFQQRGIESTQIVGIGMGLGCAMNAVGAASHRWFRKMRESSVLALCFALSGLGLLLLANQQTLPGMLVGITICSFGGGLVLPSLLTWVMRVLDMTQRGRGAGLWTSSFWIGQFVSPLVLMLLGAAYGRLEVAITWVALGALGISLIAFCNALTAACAAHREKRPENLLEEAPPARFDSK